MDMTVCPRDRRNLPPQVAERPRCDGAGGYTLKCQPFTHRVPPAHPAHSADGRALLAETNVLDYFALSDWYANLAWPPLRALAHSRPPAPHAQNEHVYARASGRVWWKGGAGLMERERVGASLKAVALS